MTSATDKTSTTTDEEKSPLAKAIGAIGLRAIGPAGMGGRIADIAVHPTRPSTWYVAVGSGGVWKTVNAGTTWTPIFDEQPSYSIGCVTIDPSRPETVWVGTGEAVSGRHVAWGDGVYRSRNGGKSWEQMGLERSEHIGDILVDPRDCNVVYVAAEGPLWSSGGQRGLYRTTDGGATWTRSLSLDDDTGVTSAVFAPDDPDTIYAAAYQRRRHVQSFVGGGPGSGIHKSTDGGQTWRKITEGLPESDMGKIGLAVTPANPDLVYATVEAEEKKERGFYRSDTRGESFERRNEYISGGTGPHYYQEIVASPIDEHRVYQVDVFVQVTTDGGKTFDNMESGKNKHSDNHAIWIDPDDGDHLLVGSDGGLYETFDDGVTFRHFPNLPVSQFYRVAVDNSLPYTNVLGGAQDLGTIYGPTRTMHVDGVRNQDWTVPLGADGYQVAFDPDDPQIAYLEWQVGNVMRLDRRTMEMVDIQPQPGPDDPPERWNWDTPIVVSPHASNRVYLASHRVWRSEDRGDSWTAISQDLTTDQNRYEMRTGDRIWSVDALYDHMAMSWFSTISHLAESPIVDGLLYVGTDDGLIQVGEPTGDETAWREAASPPNLPAEAFINNVVASEHDGDTVFVAADDHKHGDYTPYLYRSDDRGRTWRSIRGDLPDGVIVWALAQDHEVADLLFAGTEHGLYTSVDGGEHWHKITKDTPTIAIRDLAVQRRDADLVCGSFGRGFLVLDDYRPLRTVANADLEAAATLFPVRDTWWYVPYTPMQSDGQPTLGSSAFRAPNPDFGAVFTYHLGAEVHDAAGARKAKEKSLRADGADIEFPGWGQLWEEHIDTDPVVVFVIRDSAGAAVRLVAAETKAGLHRTSWDLRAEPPDPVDLTKPEFLPPWVSDPFGPMVAPGSYTAELVQVTADGPVALAGPEPFEVKPVPRDGAGGTGGEDGDTPTADDPGADFRASTADLLTAVEGAGATVKATRDRIAHLRAGLIRTPAADTGLVARLAAAHRKLEELARTLSGDPVTLEFSDPMSPGIDEMLGRVAYFHWHTTGAPTATQREAVERARAAFEPLSGELAELVDVELAAITAALDAAGGPWTPR